MKKWLALIISIVMTVSLLSACGNKNQGKSSEEVTEFSYWVNMPNEIVSVYKTMAEMTMYKELEKISGKKINFQHPPTGQGAEQFNLMIVSREFTDMIESGWTDYPGGPDKAIADGIILDLTDLIKDHAPNYYKALMSNPDYKKQASTDSGKLYGFSALNTGKFRTFGGMLIRQDWLTDLGLSLPETIEEWEIVLRAFKEKKGAKAPLTLANDTFSGNHFNNAFNVGLNLYLENGKVKLPQLEDSYKQYLTLMNKWYKEGLLDSEYDTNNGTVVDAKMTNGSSGATYGFIGGTIGKYANAMKDKEPAYKLAATQFPVMNLGDEAHFLECQKEANSPFVAISTACKDPIAAVKWLDYLYSEEGIALKNFGIEGQTYNKVDGKFVYTDEILNNPNGYSIPEAMGRNFRANTPSPGFNQHEDYLMQYYQLQEQRDALEKWSKYTPNAAKTIMPPITPTQDESEEIVSLQSDINTYSAEMILKFIKGDEPLSKYEDFVAQLNKMGAERYVNILQTAVDRYEKR